MRHWLALVALAACVDNSTVLEPVIDGPTSADEDALATGLDFITVGVAHEGALLDIKNNLYVRGQALVVDGVPFGDDLVIHMTARIGDQEVAYGRTCVFQLRSDGRIPTPHLFFSREVHFGDLSLRPLARVGGASIQYRDGSGLLIGGVAPETGEPIRQVERFDPSTGAYQTLDDLAPRTGAAVAMVGTGADARVAVIGGVDETTGAGASFVELIRADRASTRQVERIDATTTMAVVDLTATTLANGDILVIGGQKPGLSPTPSDAVATITVSNNMPNVNDTIAKLATPRYGHTATRLADDVGAPVLVAGGRNAMGAPVAAAELYKPLRGGFTVGFNATMAIPRYRHQAVRLPDGSVMFIGGIDANGVAIKEIEVFSLDTGFRTMNSTLPSGAGLVDLTATVLPDGRVLLAGGRASVDGPPVANAYIARLDPVNGSVDIAVTDRLALPRAGHQATLLCDGTVLISGGTPDQEVYERYNPVPTGRR